MEYLATDGAPPRKRRTYSQFSIDEKEVQRFTAICKIVKILLKHLQTNEELTTIRDIYYQDVEVFSHKQTECQFLMKQVAEDCLGLSLFHDFNIHPTQKGLVFGNFFKALEPKNDPMLIPIDYADAFKDKSSGGSQVTVIIVEKDSVFQYLCSHLSRQPTLLADFLVVTGKGYSDQLTLRFLDWLQQTHECRFLGFFDSDVYGINIYKQYHRIIKGVLYAGIYLMDSDPSTWLSIMTRDVAIMINLCNTCHEISTVVQRELTRGLFLLKKAEINVTNVNDDRLGYVDYIVKKVGESNLAKGCN
ncbi:Meiotic recombination protein rec12 [Candida viswanathii]|uniref:DNA topoisomerase (ATP-hydrolyzing) n=1 Tax=Candida viswanathii TaxID=5486 RepID=A0A367XND9_9ASCO|nr:Meiotic recombination protein rec12 [Candida viswanathii]